SQPVAPQSTATLRTRSPTREPRTRDSEPKPHANLPRARNRTRPERPQHQEVRHAAIRRRVAEDHRRRVLEGRPIADVENLAEQIECSIFVLEEPVAHAEVQLSDPQAVGTFASALVKDG